ncbi:NAD(P)-dependent oxidoreductase [Pseudonocardia sp. MH-G8]|uniref:NAD-dependent epimerase/dehydratase family protein n=1 Tax=Pseudonocardia sp. MH-G8 TaxID=1854588 RepID=UPI000BA09875|nr:NAD(P)-dependent oxidoreductase [Pseudonocardia sp. MH-G8]OZM75931.1 UDP-glucose 4-epimerase [Pseudonocardia sp. MH-G8]
MRIAVTGAAGRLGRRVVARALDAGHEVIAADLPAALEGQQVDGVEWRSADVTDLEQVRAALAGAQGVVHLGALIHPRYPEPLVTRTNVDGTHHVLVAAEEHGAGAVCLASSINAIGGVFSAAARYDAFPVTEEHASYCEDSYSLSKWILEQQSAAFARRRPEVAFTALRLHALCEDHAEARERCDDERRRGELWGWTSLDSAAAACLLALHRRAPGHAVCNVVATRTASGTPSEELARRWYPDVPLTTPLPGDAGFYATGAGLAVLGWDARDEHPALSDDERADGERADGASAGPAGRA